MSARTDRSGRQPVARHGVLRSPNPFLQILTVLGAIVAVAVLSVSAIGAYTVWDAAQAVSDAGVSIGDDDTTLPTCDNGDSLVSFTVAEGQTYRIAVDGKAGASGFLHLALVAKPLNDDFADATVLDGTSDFGSGFTTLAGGEPGEPQHGGVGSGHSLWFSWTAPVGGLVELSTCTNDVDPVLAVYTGSAVNALTQVVADDDAGSPDCSPQDSAVSFAATAGTTYRIAADSVSGAGRIEVTLARPADTTAPDTNMSRRPTRSPRRPATMSSAAKTSE